MALSLKSDTGLFCPGEVATESHALPLETSCCIIYAHNERLLAYSIFYYNLFFPPWSPSLSLHSDSFLIGAEKLRHIMHCICSPDSDFPGLLKMWGLLQCLCVLVWGQGHRFQQWPFKGNFLWGVEQRGWLDEAVTIWRAINVFIKGIQRHS